MIALIQRVREASVTVDGAGVAGVLPAVGVLALFFAGLAALAMARLAVKRD